MLTVERPPGGPETRQVLRHVTYTPFGKQRGGSGLAER